MGAPVYTADDYQRALWNLMPRGRAWNKEPGSVQSQVLLGLSQAFARLNDRSNNLIADSFPLETYELLPEWEESVGLPDSCAGLGATVQARRATMLAKFINTGGQSVQAMTDFANLLGFTISITEYAPFRVGQQRTGAPLNGQDWAFTWAINSPTNTLFSFRTGESAVGEPLSSWSNAALICSMEKISPAHTVLQFIYH